MAPRETFFLDGKIDSTTHQLLRKHFEIYGSSSVVVINSPGGDAYCIAGVCALFLMYEPSVIIPGHAMSAACVIASYGRKGARTAGKYASFMIHKVRMFQLTQKELDNRIKQENQDKETERLNSVLFGLLEERTGVKAEEWQKYCSESPYGDFYFGAETAKKLGIIDLVI